MSKQDKLDFAKSVLERRKKLQKKEAVNPEILTESNMINSKESDKVMIPETHVTTQHIQESVPMTEKLLGNFSDRILQEFKTQTSVHGISDLPKVQFQDSATQSIIPNQMVDMATVTQIVDKKDLAVNTAATATRESFTQIDISSKTPIISKSDVSSQYTMKTDHFQTQTETKLDSVEKTCQTETDKQIGILTTRLMALEQEKISMQSQVHHSKTMYEQLLQLQKENERLQKELTNEKKIVVLLSAEVDALPDMIEKYHQERNLLRLKNKVADITINCANCQASPFIIL